MLANILNSKRAIQVSIRIVEIFIKIREYILTNQDLLLKIQHLEKRLGNQDEKITLVFEYLKKSLLRFRTIPGNELVSKEKASNN